MSSPTSTPNPSTSDELTTDDIQPREAVLDPRPGLSQYASPELPITSLIQSGDRSISITILHPELAPAHQLVPWYVSSELQTLRELMNRLTTKLGISSTSVARYVFVVDGVEVPPFITIQSVVLKRQTLGIVVQLH